MLLETNFCITFNVRDLLVRFVALLSSDQMNFAWQIIKQMKNVIDFH